MSKETICSKIKSYALRNREKISKRVKTLLFLLVFSAVAYFIFNNIAQISTHKFKINPYSFLISILCFAFSQLLLATIWYSITKSQGIVLSWSKTVKGWFNSQLGKYVPGKITLFLIRFESYKKYPKEKVTLALFLEQIASLSGGFLVLLFCIYSIKGILPDIFKWITLFLIILLLVMLYPPVLKKFTGKILILLKKDDAIEYPTIKSLAKWIVMYASGSILQGISLFYMIQALTPVEPQYMIPIIALSEATALIGYFAVFAPSGIGVREGALILFLSSIIPKPVVIIVTLITRLQIIITELIMAGIFSAIIK